ncbi:uncharacterized protein LOC114758510 [Neltuma alba]|uniref:uncharacterized protein LOC114758510 n=1 Tax=Neltuma alba TaxID=207710 RepID=UPI0010A5153F|nr:uncharacterized protein LOC114758510 [Prosopis alba]
MAPETRSERFSELEHRLDLQQASIDSINARLDDLQSTNTRFDDYLKDIAAKVSSLLTDTGKRTAVGEGGSSSLSPPRIPTFGSFHELHNPHSAYSVPTKQSRVDFPKFDGSDFRGWAYRCRQFFEVDGTPPEHRIRLLSIHLEGHALRWHQTFMRHRSFSDISWSDYFSHMEKKFADVHDESPTIALKKLQQLDRPVPEYERQFDELLSEVDIPDDVAMNLFIGGLRADVQKSVLNFSPSSLSSAMYCARLQEATIRAIHEHAPVGRRHIMPSLKPFHLNGLKSSTVMDSPSGPSLADSQPGTVKSPAQYTSVKPAYSASASSPGYSGVPSKPSKQLSRKEMDERRRKGLCYWCTEKYTAGHRCKDSQLFLLVVDDNEEYFEDALEEVPVESGRINAIEGQEEVSTLKLVGRIKNQTVIILIDTGSTHNVLDASTARRLQLKSQERSPVQLTVADTRKIGLIPSSLSYDQQQELTRVFSSF